MTEEESPYHLSENLLPTTQTTVTDYPETAAYMTVRDTKKSGSIKCVTLRCSLALVLVYTWIRIWLLYQATLVGYEVDIKEYH